MLNIHGTLQQKSNARKAQSIVVAKYPWFGAAEIKILCEEGTLQKKSNARKAGAVYHRRWIYITRCSWIRIGQEGMVYILDVQYIWLFVSSIYPTFFLWNENKSCCLWSRKFSPQTILGIDILNLISELTIWHTIAFRLKNSFKFSYPLVF